METLKSRSQGGDIRLYFRKMTFGDRVVDGLEGFKLKAARFVRKMLP